MGTIHTRNKARLTITAGRNFLNMGILSAQVSFEQGEDGYVTIGKLPYKFEILEYSWEGATYKSVSTTTSQNQAKGKNNGKEKRTGRLSGAVLGTVLFPGIGTIAGAALGTEKKSKGKSDMTTVGNEVTSEQQIEVDSNATMKLRNVDTREEFTIGFLCNTKTDVQIRNFHIRKDPSMQGKLGAQKDSIQLLKEYKELLDMGVITQEEFMQKKNELL